MSSLSARIAKAWDADFSLSVLLVMLVLLLFVVTPLTSGKTIRAEVGTAFFSLVTLTGVVAVARRASIIAFVVACAAGSFALDWIAHFSPSPDWELADLAMRIGFVLLLGVVVMSQVFRPGDITHHRVQGAIVVYLLAGLAWAHAYQILGILDHNAIRYTGPADALGSASGVLRYYSFETLTTLGYGDIVPVSPIARALASSEAVFGQLYPAAMIARLVSLEMLDRGTGRRSNDLQKPK
jgi:hypothetical protein